jgi:aminopeptidase N
MPDNETWLTQSFAEYLSGNAMDLLTPEESSGIGFSDIRCEWRRGAFLIPRRDGAILAEEGRPGQPADSVLEARGPLVIHMLRSLAGEERFFRILQRFLRESEESGGTTDRLRAIGEEVLQTDLGWFFEQWVRSGGIPKVHVSWRVEPTPDGGATLTGRAVQPEGPGFKRLRIPIVPTISGHAADALIVDQDRPVTEFRFALSEVPEDLEIDPACETLAVYRRW